MKHQLCSQDIIIAQYSSHGVLLPTITEVITIAVTKAITKETSAVSSGPGGENPTRIPELIISLASHHYQPARTVRVPRSHNAYCNPAHGSLFAARTTILAVTVTNPRLQQPHADLVAPVDSPSIGRLATVSSETP